MKYLLVCFLFAFSATVANGEEVKDYYWRDFFGTIPPDAIPGGRDRTGKITYIAQVYHNGIYPGTIYQGSAKALALAVDGSHIESDRFVKILCGRHLSKYQWIKTTANETHLLTDCELINGGIVGDSILNIGRANNAQELMIGRVYPTEGLSVASSEGPANYRTFEILAYNCVKWNPCPSYNNNYFVYKQFGI